MHSNIYKEANLNFMTTVYVVYYLGNPSCVALTEGEALRLVELNNPGTSAYRELPFYIPDDFEVKIIAGPIPKMPKKLKVWHPKQKVTPV